MNYQLPEEITISSAVSVQEELEKNLLNSGSEEVVLDGTQVTDVDGAGIQLLLSLYKSLTAQGRDLRIESPSSALKKALEHSGAEAII